MDINADDLVLLLWKYSNSRGSLSSVLGAVNDRRISWHDWPHRAARELIEKNLVAEVLGGILRSSNAAAAAEARRLAGPQPELPPRGTPFPQVLAAAHALGRAHECHIDKLMAQGQWPSADWALIVQAIRAGWRHAYPALDEQERAAYDDYLEGSYRG